MSVWLSGIVFLFCCEMPAAAAEKEFCPLTKASELCDKTKNSKNSRISKDGNRTVDCCEFFPTIFDKVRKIDKNDSIELQAERLEVEVPRLVIIAGNFTIPATYKPLPPARSRIFIRNRVLRI